MMIGKFFATGSLLIALGLLNTSYADSARNQANNMPWNEGGSRVPILATMALNSLLL